MSLRRPSPASRCPRAAVRADRRRALMALGSGAGAALLAAFGLVGLARPVHAGARPSGVVDGPGGVPGRSTAGPVSAVDFDWFDAERERAVPVRLYLPLQEGRARRRLPLVVFSHGIGGSRRGYQYLGRHWAAHGWASLHLQHVGSDNRLWGGNPLAMAGRLRDAVTDAEAVARVQDLRFALDTVLAGELAPRLDRSRIVAAGHSYGANTTLLAAGAQIPRAAESGLPPLHDERVRAAIVLSAPPFYGERDFAPILRGIDLPSLHITATADDIRIPGFYSGIEDRLAVFEAIGGRPKALAVFEGGSHSIFTDRAGTGGPALNAQVKSATQELTLAFLQRVFEGDGRALAGWPQRHTEILAQFSTLGLERA
jgi:dienelactone hydrolase